MATVPKFHAASALLIAFALLCPSAHALVSFNEGSDHLFFTGSISMEYDSNIFAHVAGEGDTIYSCGLLLEYTRRAGLIGVDASVGLDASLFSQFTAQNFKDPRFKAEFTKATGRTTGSLSLGAARVSEADALANVRTQSWNYDADFKFKYPVIERYSFAGDLAYSDRVYDQSAGLTDLRTYTAGADLLYAIDSRKNLLAGYQYRHSNTSASSTYDDQSFTLGLTSRIISKLNGSLRAGYQVRTPTGSTLDGSYKGLTASGSVSWAMTSKLSLTGQVAKDVSVTADNQSVDSASTGLTLQYAKNDRLSVSTNLGAGSNRFLSSTSAGRHDTYFTWGAGLKCKLLEHLDSSLAYVYDENWSTLSYSDFTRHIVTVSLSSRW